MKGKNAYKQSYSCVTMEVNVLERGRIVEKMAVTDTVGLKRLMKKYLE